MSSTKQIPAELHVKIYQGDAWSIAIDCSLNLTGYTITATVHHKGSDTVTALAKTDTNLALGQFSIALTTELSAALATEHHYWCLVMTPPGSPSLPRTYIAGRFIVEACE